MKSFSRFLFIPITWLSVFALAQPDPEMGSMNSDWQTADIVQQDNAGARSRDKVVFNLEYDTFDKDLTSWTQGYLSYGHRFDFGSVIARYNRAYRFGTNGDQLEIDLYPKIHSGTYAYLNYGVSSSSIFPKSRSGAEIFQSLPWSLEFSIGMRKLVFASSDVTLWTGSLAHYIGSYYLYMRTYHVPDKIGPSNSWTFGTRYYFDDDQYMEAAIGSGISTETIFYSAESAKLSSQKGKINVYWALTSEVFIQPTLAYYREEVRVNDYRIMHVFDVSLEKRF